MEIGEVIRVAVFEPIDETPAPVEPEQVEELAEALIVQS